jgi:hypothetical protein
MNMMTTESDLKKYAEPTSSPALKRLMAAWESKQASAARKAGGFGLIAVSLAACGSDSETVVTPPPPPPPPPVVNETFTLTIDADPTTAGIEFDNITGGPGNDTFNAPLGLFNAFGLIGQALAPTLQGEDVLDGGGGFNTLNAVLNGNFGIITGNAPTITNIQVINFEMRESPLIPGGLFGGFFTAINFDNVSGAQQIWLENSESVELVVYNVQAGAFVGMRNVEDVGYSVFYDADALGGEYAQVVFLNNVTEGYLEIGANGDDSIITLDLRVSNGVELFLEGDAADIENLIISGTGPLDLAGEGNFVNLVTLNSTGYDEDLELDVSGSEVLEDVATGNGNDLIIVNRLALDGDLSVDLGGEAPDTIGDILAIAGGGEGGLGSFSESDINNLDFTGGMTSVENLAFLGRVDLDGPAVLDLDGFDTALKTIWFFDGIDGNGAELALANSPVADLTINSTFIDWLELDTGNVVNLTVNVSDVDAELDLDAVSGADLESLTLNQLNGVGGQIWLDINSSAANDVSALQTISVTAAGSADVDLEASGATSDMNALTSVTVIAGVDADLQMQGVDPVQQLQTFTAAGAFIGVVVLAFDIPGVVGNVTGTGTSVSTLVANLNTNLTAANAGYVASFTGTLITFTRVEPGPAAPITLNAAASLGLGAVTVTNNGITVPGVVAAGFEGLETVVVTAGGNADVDLTSVYGAFTLEVTAGDDAYVDLENTNAVSVMVEAEYAEINVSDDLYGNPNLVSITVDADVAEINLSGDLSSFATLDVANVVTDLYVDAADAEYAEGSIVTYLIGSTEVVEFYAEAGGDVREVFQFTGDNIGDVVIHNFDVGGLAEGNRDIIDFSQFAGVTSVLDLAFAVDGDDIVITAASGQFDGSITIVDAALLYTTSEVEQFNIQYV